MEINLRIAAIFIICLAIFDAFKMAFGHTASAVIFALGVIAAIGIAMQSI